MERYFVSDLEIIFDFFGRNDWAKFSFPTWYGIPVKVKWQGYTFDFNLRGGLKRIGGNQSVWINPLEQLKRTDGNDLVYYGTFDYQLSYNLIKNYYVPYTGRDNCGIFNETPLKTPHVEKALKTFDLLIGRMQELSLSLKSGRAKVFLKKTADFGRKALAREAGKLHNIIGGRLPVLPPDTIDVDYEVIPVMIRDGCDYQCSFCRFKTGGESQVRTGENIKQQISALREVYGEDLINYNSLVLGQNDALAAGEELLEETAQIAYTILQLGESYHRGDPNLFLFGGVDSLLKGEARLFKMFNSLPYHVYINVGFESPDQETLDILGKPFRAPDIKEAFQKAQYINSHYDRVHITGNFILGKDLPTRHLESIKLLLSGGGFRKGKGTCYLSPLIGASHRRQILRDFREIKRSSPLPVYLYLVQRL